VPASSTHTPV